MKSSALVAVVALLGALSQCAERSGEESGGAPGRGSGAGEDWAVQREAMVRDQILARGVDDPAVLRAMGRVPRHLFVPREERERAYQDTALPIGHDQTISQPYIVALMTSLLAVGPGARVLEVGTGSGYQAAVLSEIVDSVFTVEIVEPLAESARERLASLGYDRVRVQVGDGYQGWAEKAPFDGIIVTCAPRDIPSPLVEQLKEGGRLVIPCGERWFQELILAVKEEGKIRTESVLPVRFVPLTGPHGGE